MTGPRLDVAFWHEDGTGCGHGWPAGTVPPAVTSDAGMTVRTPVTAGAPLLCAAGQPVSHFQVTVHAPPPGWTSLGPLAGGGEAWFAPLDTPDTPPGPPPGTPGESSLDPRRGGHTPPADQP